MVGPWSKGPGAQKVALDLRSQSQQRAELAVKSELGNCLCLFCLRLVNTPVYRRLGGPVRAWKLGRSQAQSEIFLFLYRYV